MKDHTRGESAVSAGFAVLTLAGLLVWLGYNLGTADGGRDAYRAFRDGRAQVITYTIPGSGECRAVLIDGTRVAEACE